MQNFYQIAARLLALEFRQLGAGAAASEIDAAEKVLGLRIEGGYRQFLERFGWGGAGHFELFGLGKDVPFHLDLVRLTQSERREMQPRLAPYLLPLMNDGGGNLYCIDTRISSEPPVVFWDHQMGPDQKPALDASNFATWLSRLL